MHIYFTGILREYYNAVIVASKAFIDEKYIQPRLHQLMHAKSFVAHNRFNTSVIIPFYFGRKSYLYDKHMQCCRVFI